MNQLNNSIIQEQTEYGVKEFIQDVKPSLELYTADTQYGVNEPRINGLTGLYNVATGTGTADGVGWTNTIDFTSTDYNTVSWTGGDILLADGSTYSVTAGNTGNMTAITYIYFDYILLDLVVTTTAADSVGTDKLLIAVAGPTETGKDAQYQVFGTFDQSVFITADNIAANSITANELNVNTLSAISADLGAVTAGTITGATIRTAATGERTIITGSDNSINWYDGDDNNILTLGYSGAQKNIIWSSIPNDGNNTYPGFFLENKRSSNTMIVNGFHSGANTVAAFINQSEYPGPGLYGDSPIALFRNGSNSYETVSIQNFGSKEALKLYSSGSSNTIDIENVSTGRGITVTTNGGTGLYHSGGDANTLISRTSSNASPAIDISNSATGGSSSYTNGIVVRTYGDSWNTLIDGNGSGGGIYIDVSSGSDGIYINSGKLKIPVGTNLY